jgi:hypothetical protein
MQVTTEELLALRPGAEFANVDRTLAGVRWDGAAEPVGALELLALRLGRARAARIRAVGAELADRLAAGLVWQGVAWQIDDLSQQRIAARALYARACLDGAETWDQAIGSWIAADNSVQTFATAQAFWDFAKAAQARVTTLVRRARALKDAVLAIGTDPVPDTVEAFDQAIADVAAIDVSAGWEEQP